MKIDSHHHFWKYDPHTYSWMDEKMEVLKIDYQPADLKKEIAEAGIDGVVSVQADQSLRETDDLLEHARTNDFILGVVGWFPLADNKVRDLFDKYSNNELLKGVRHVVQDEPDDNFILDDQFNRGVSLLKDYNWVYDILIYERQLGPSIQFVDRFYHMNRNPDRPSLISNRSRYGLSYPPRRISRKLISTPVFEFIYSLHQAYIPFLD